VALFVKERHLFPERAFRGEGAHFKGGFFDQFWQRLSDIRLYGRQHRWISIGTDAELDLYDRPDVAAGGKGRRV
jgi:hypothetical protein